MPDLDPIVVVADDPETFAAAERLVATKGFGLHFALSDDDAVQLAKAHQPRVIVLRSEIARAGARAACLRAASPLSPLLLQIANSAGHKDPTGLADAYLTEPVDPLVLTVTLTSMAK